MKMQFSYSVFVYFFIIGAGGFCLLASLASQPETTPQGSVPLPHLRPASISTVILSPEPTPDSGGKSENSQLGDSTPTLTLTLTLTPNTHSHGLSPSSVLPSPMIVNERGIGIRPPGAGLNPGAFEAGGAGGGITIT